MAHGGTISIGSCQDIERSIGDGDGWETQCGVRRSGNVDTSLRPLVRNGEPARNRSRKGHCRTGDGCRCCRLQGKLGRRDNPNRDRDAVAEALTVGNRHPVETRDIGLDVIQDQRSVRLAGNCRSVEIPLIGDRLDGAGGGDRECSRTTDCDGKRLGSGSDDRRNDIGVAGKDEIRPIGAHEEAGCSVEGDDPVGGKEIPESAGQAAGSTHNRETLG